MVMCSGAAVRHSGAIASAKVPADTPMAGPISGGISAATSAGAAAWNPGKCYAAAADLRSAVVRTSSGYIGAVDNPNNSTAVVAVKARPNRDGTATVAPRRSATRGHDRLTDCGAGRRLLRSRCRPAACTSTDCFTSW